MASLIRAHDWASTPLGPVETWPAVLRSTTDLMLAHGFPMVVLWGPELVQVYNDGYRLIMGVKHPTGLGQPTRDCWPEVWHINAPIYDRVRSGETVTFRDALYPITRSGRLENAWFTLTYSPLRDDRAIAGVLVTVFEVTEQVLARNALANSEALRRVALAGGRMGTWQWDLHARLVWGDAQFLALWGFPSSDDPLPLSLFTDRQSPEGLAQTEGVVMKAIETGEEFDSMVEVASGPTSGRWLRWRGRASKTDPSTLYGVSFDITDQRRAEASLRETERQQAYLLNLSDALRWLTDPRAIAAEATRLLGEHLKADRTFLTEVATDGVTLYVRDEYLRAGAPSVLGQYSFDQFGAFVSREMHQGRVLAVEDVSARTDLHVDERAIYAAVGIAAYLLIPLIRDGRLAAYFTINHRTPRPWTKTDRAIAQQTADRTWAAVERGRIEEALRASEEQQRLTVQLVPALLWRADPAGRDIAMNEQWKISTGQSDAETQNFGWLDVIHPDDVAAARATFRHAFAAGEPLERQQRIYKVNDGYRWHLVRHVPVRDESGAIVRWFGAAIDVHDLHELQDRQQVLVAELQHRTRNLMSVVRSTLESTLRASANLDDFATRFRDQVDALSRVQRLLSRLKHEERVTFDQLIRDEMAAVGASERVSLAGPPGVALRSSTVQTFALALHELATNAVKYGALAQASGRLAITWRLEAAQPGGKPWLHVDWHESGVTMPLADAAPRGTGQGRQLIERALPYQLGAKTTYVIGPDGVRCSISVPVSNRTAAVETDNDCAHPP